MKDNQKIYIRRSMLYVPAISDKMIRKAAGLDADAVIIDLEDAVSQEKKEEARKIISELLKEVDFKGKEVVVRINSIPSGIWRDDLNAVISDKLNAILLPKVEHPEDVKMVEGEINKLKMSREIKSDISIMCMMETPLCILNAKEIAGSSPLLKALLFGAADYTKETRGIISTSRIELLYPMSVILLSARAFGLDAIDAPFFNIKDQKGLEEHCLQAKNLGFDGKQAIHPGQLETINRTFSPSEKEIEWAKRVIEVFSKAVSEGKGVCTLDGELVEVLHYRRAKRILKVTERINKGGHNEAL